MKALAAVGDNVSDIYASLGRAFPGGNALNVAVAARKAGMDAAYLGAIGTDEAGRAIKAALDSEGVRTERLRIVEGPNAYSVVELDGGDRRFVGYGLGVSRFVLDARDLEYLEQFDCVHSGARSGTEEQMEDMASAARLSFDFSDRPSEYWEPLLDKVWMACFSGTGLDTDGVHELTRQVLRAGPEVLLITEGSRGASISTAYGETVHADAEPVTPLDTLGAGDAVIGTVLAGVLRGDDLGVVMSSAMSVAAQVCAHHGAFGQGRPFC
ncbi:MAG: PfkB family carbohydrate kinase [Acidimicrobiales bacterium]